MSDDSPPTHPETTSAQPAPSAETATNPHPDHPDGKKVITTPVAVLFTVCALLLGILIAVSLRRHVDTEGVSSSDPKLASAKADAKALLDDLNRERAELGKPPISDSTNSESIEDISSRLKKDVASLANLSGSFQQMLAERDARISEATRQTLESERIRRSLAMENTRLTNERDKAIIQAGGSDTLRQQLDDVTKELTTLRQQVASAKGRPPTAEYDAVKRQLEEANSARAFFETRAKELEGKVGNADPAELTKLRAEVVRLQTELGKSHLFASSDDQLLPSSALLSKELRELTDKTQAEASDAYDKISEKYGANVVKTIIYPAGSSTPPQEDQPALRALATNMPEDCTLLVVGYASQTGNADSNRTLSSNRATTVAETLNATKHAQQLVQAVYLGQTGRFGAKPENNQICEIWQIPAKK